MGVMIVSLTGCLGLMREVNRVRHWGSVSPYDLAADASCLLRELGHERVLVSMFCCDARPLVGAVGHVVTDTTGLLVLDWMGGASKAFIRVKWIGVAVTVRGSSRKAKG